MYCVICENDRFCSEYAIAVIVAVFGGICIGVVYCEDVAFGYEPSVV